MLVIEEDFFLSFSVIFGFKQMSKKLWNQERGCIDNLLKLPLCAIHADRIKSGILLNLFVAFIAIQIGKLRSNLQSIEKI